MTVRTIAAVVLAVVAFPAVAVGHAILVRSSPVPRAALRDPPKQIELWFNERLEPAYSSVSVLTQSGAPVRTRPAIVGPDGKRLTVELPPVPPGSYTVRFRVLSVDGHLAEDGFTFTVR
jgi:methionine-rich copper-binding protein CopC